MFELTTCAMTKDDGRDCGAPRAADAPVPICMDHARSVYLYFADFLAAVRERTPEQEADWSKAGELDVPFTGLAVQPSIVYYIRIGNLIKIGYTGSFHDRMRSLMPDEILAIEEGDRELERQRHIQFAWSKAPKGAEYFYPTVDVMEHIAKVRALDWKPPAVLQVPGWAVGQICPSCDLKTLWFDGDRATCTRCKATVELPNYPPPGARIVRPAC